MEPAKPDNRSLLARLTEPEMLVGLSAVVIGVCALLVSIVQVHILRQEQHTSVWPRLHVEQHHARGRYLELVVVNRGLGPALIEEVRVTVDGQPMTSWSAALEALALGRAPRDLALTAINGRILSAGESVVALATADAAVADTVAAQAGRVRIETCYCSVYAQCWHMTRAFEDGRPPVHERVAACPEDGAGRFAD